MATSSYYLPGIDGYAATSMKPKPFQSIKDRMMQQNADRGAVTNNPVLWAYFLTLSLLVVEMPKPADGLVVEVLWLVMKTYVVAIYFWTLRALVRERMRVVRHEVAIRQVSTALSHAEGRS